MHNENLVDVKVLTEYLYGERNVYVYVEQAGQPVTLIEVVEGMVQRCSVLTAELLDDPHAVQALRSNGFNPDDCYVRAYYTDRTDGEEIIVMEAMKPGRALILTRTTRVSYGLRG